MPRSLQIRSHNVLDFNPCFAVLRNDQTNNTQSTRSSWYCTHHIIAFNLRLSTQDLSNLASHFSQAIISSSTLNSSPLHGGSSLSVLVLIQTVSHFMVGDTLQISSQCLLCLQTRIQRLCLVAGRTH